MVLTEGLEAMEGKDEKKKIIGRVSVLFDPLCSVSHDLLSP